jgi:hypothetical protein
MNDLINIGLTKVETKFQSAEIFKRSVMMSRSAISTINNALSILSNEGIAYNSKRFLMAFYMYYFTEEVIDNIFVPIYFISKSLVMSLRAYEDNPGNETQEVFLMYLDLYEAEYGDWIKKDREKIINNMLIQFFDLKNTLSNLDNKVHRSLKVDGKTSLCLKNIMKTVRKRLGFFNASCKIEEYEVKMGGDIRIILDTIKAKNMSGFEVCGSETDMIAKKAFWDHMEFVLKTNPADTEIYKIITEIKNKMKELVPNRSDIHAYYDEYLDEEFIRQIVVNRANSSDTLNNLVCFTMERLKELDHSRGISQINNWLDNWNKIQKCCFDLHEILPYCFRDIINRVERISNIMSHIRNKN